MTEQRYSGKLIVSNDFALLKRLTKTLPVEHKMGLGSDFEQEVRKVVLTGAPLEEVDERILDHINHFLDYSLEMQRRISPEESLPTVISYHIGFLPHYIPSLFPDFQVIYLWRDDIRVLDRIYDFHKGRNDQNRDNVKVPSGMYGIEDETDLRLYADTDKTARMIMRQYAIKLSLGELSDILPKDDLIKIDHDHEQAEIVTNALGVNLSYTIPGFPLLSERVREDYDFVFERLEAKYKR